MIGRNIIAVAALAVSFSAAANAQTFQSSAGPLQVETFASGLVNPWAMAFLPDGRILVTERPGRMRIVARDGQLSAPVAGLPQVWAQRQGGLLDVIADRNFAQNRTIFFCYAENVGGGGRTTVARARLADGEPLRIDQVGAIFHQEGPLSSGAHYGCRMAQANDGNLFVGLGDHFTHRNEAQNLGNHIGKLIRIGPGGKTPAGNPFADRNGAREEIWSYGHRNIQGLVLHPTTGALWEIEHGPRGGDEINVVARGKNYGWPVIGYGIDYNGSRIHESTQKDGMEQPAKYWVPSIAPSGAAFMTGDLFPSWRGNLFVGALAGQMLVRLTVDGDRVTGEERLLEGLNERIRDVRISADGTIWLLTDSAQGRLLRVRPGK
jgi:glucose/arabinose dehydrogenase